MAKTRVGFIGAGGIASRHFHDLQQFDDVQVVAVADVQRERAEALAAPCGATPYTSYEEMLVAGGLDAVYICVPPFAHGAPELACIEHDLPFFVEKPLATDWVTAERIAAGIADRSLVSAVGYHWRYLDTTQEAGELLAQNPARLALGYWIDSTPPPGWWIKQAESGGQMLEQTTHIFDLARVLIGDVTKVYAAGAKTPRAEFAHADVHDVTAATLHFAGGAIGTMASSCLLRWPHRIGLHLFGDGLAIELSEFEIMVDVGRGRPTRHAEGDPFIREDREFINAVQGKAADVRAPYAEALRTHRVTTAATQSLLKDRPITL